MVQHNRFMQDPGYHEWMIKQNRWYLDRTKRNPTYSFGKLDPDLFNKRLRVDIRFYYWFGRKINLSYQAGYSLVKGAMGRAFELRTAYMNWKAKKVGFKMPEDVNKFSIYNPIR